MVAPIKFSDVLIGMVLGVQVSGVNIQSAKTAKSPQRRRKVNAVATQAAKAREHASPEIISLLLRLPAPLSNTSVLEKRIKALSRIKVVQ